MFKMHAKHCVRNPKMVKSVNSIKLDGSPALAAHAIAVPDSQIPWQAKAACVLMLADIILMSWLGSGTRAVFLMPMMWVSVAMFVFSAFSSNGKYEPLYVKVALWCGTIILSINAVQTVNHSLVYIVTERFNTFEAVGHISWLPVSVKSNFFMGDALRSLARIATAFSIFMSAGIIFKYERITRICLVFFAVNATAMAAWGVYQREAGFAVMYGRFYALSDFYGSFFLSNAAGAFINLGLAANFALFFMYPLRCGYFCRILYGSFFLGSAAVCLFSCYKSGSNGALAISGAMCIVFAGVCVYAVIRKFLSVRIAIVAVILVGLAFCVLSYVAYGSSVISPKRWFESEAVESVSSRKMIYDAAFRTVKNNVIWGMGGDSVRYHLPQNLRQNDRKNYMFVTADRAHSGILEYFMEFGIIGVLAIVVAGIVWMVYFLVRIRELDLANFIIMAGVLLFLFYSCFDIHLHIPSTMMAGALMAVVAVSPMNERVR